MRNIALVAFFFYSFSINAQEKKSNDYEWMVYIKPNQTISTEFQNFLATYEAKLIRAISISEEKLEELSKNALLISKSDESVRKLKNIYKIEFKNVLLNNTEFFKQLSGFNEVEQYYLRNNAIIEPPTDISPTTSNFETNQTYLGPNPGVNMQYAWDLGLSGSGIKVRDIEYGFNANHEDLNSVNVSIASGMTISSSAVPAYVEHGTPVFGIVMADKGTYGVSGLAYSAQEMILFPEFQESGYDRIYAISQAIQNSQPGDVIIYEMQAYDENNYLMPAEYDLTVWNLTKAATDAGIMIFEAAANGNRNLDSAVYTAYMNRGNSGAILVGAGSSNLNHNRLSYSNYGSRVDVQGWGQNVYTTGFTGAYITIGGDLNQAYTNFSGTSSATPMVAGCAIVLQSYYHSLTGNYLSPVQMRNLLITTGIPQGTSVAGQIGPLPNMQNAINAIDNMLSVQSFDGISAEFFPNPTNDKLNYSISNSEDSKVNFQFLDVLGRRIKQVEKSESSGVLEMNELPAGIYFLKVNCGDKEFTKRIIKK